MTYDDYLDWQNWWLVARFKSRYPHDIPTPGHLQAMAAIVEGLGSPWNISTNWDRCEWYHSAKGAISLVYRNSISTYDHDKLTKIVLAAHRNCVRIEIEGCGPRMMRVTFWPRDRGQTDWSCKHPDLADLAALAGRVEELA